LGAVVHRSIPEKGKEKSGDKEKPAIVRRELVLELRTEGSGVGRGGDFLRRNEEEFALVSETSKFAANASGKKKMVRGGDCALCEKGRLWGKGTMAFKGFDTGTVDGKGAAFGQVIASVRWQRGWTESRRRFSMQQEILVAKGRSFRILQGAWRFKGGGEKSKAMENSSGKRSVCIAKTGPGKFTHAGGYDHTGRKQRRINKRRSYPSPYLTS